MDTLLIVSTLPSSIPSPRLPGSRGTHLPKDVRASNTYKDALNPNPKALTPHQNHLVQLGCLDQERLQRLQPRAHAVVCGVLGGAGGWGQPPQGSPINAACYRDGKRCHAARNPKPYTLTRQGGPQRDIVDLWRRHPGEQVREDAWG